MRPHPGFPLREGKLLKPSHLSSQRLKSLAIGRPAVASQPLWRRMERTGKAICKGPGRTAVGAEEAGRGCWERASSHLGKRDDVARQLLNDTMTDNCEATAR